jgi:folate-binding protein YgfZ
MIIKPMSTHAHEPSASQTTPPMSSRQASDHGFPPGAPPDWQGVCTLPHLGLIQAEGADTASFLHGQLSQDVQLLPAGQARLGAYCTAKGRMLADFLLWRHGDDGVRLLLTASLLPATLKRLSMFVLRAKVKLTDALAPTQASAQSLRGVVGLPLIVRLAEAAGGMAPATNEVLALPEGAQLVRLPDVQGVARALWVGPAAQADALSALPAVSPALWHWLEVMSGVPRIEASTVEQFVPQMINYELVGGVNFRKGCYPGQEVVARSQYRGTVKRRLHLAHVEGTSTPAAGQEVFASTDPEQPCGMVVNAAAAPKGGWVCSLELKLDHASAVLHLGSAQGSTLQLQALPYALPTADAEA